MQAIGIGSVVVAGGCALRRSDDGGTPSGRCPGRAAKPAAASRSRRSLFPTPSTGYLLLEDGRVYRSGNGGAALGADRGRARHGRDDGSTASPRTRLPDRGCRRRRDRGRPLSHERRRSILESRRSSAGGHRGHFPRRAERLRGRRRRLLSSVDGGKTWSPVMPPSSPAGSRLRSIRCASPLALPRHGAGRRSPHPHHRRRVRPGTSSTSARDGRCRRLRDAAASRSRPAAWAPCRLSADGGASGPRWAAVWAAASRDWRQLRGSRAFAIGRARPLAATSDEGLSWRYLAAPSDQDVIDVSFPTSSTGFALDGAGALFRTDDGGGSWRAARHRAPRSFPQAVLALDADRVLLIGTQGHPAVDGRRPELQAGAPRRVRRAGVCSASTTRPAGCSPTARGQSSPRVDGGRRWRKLARPDHRPLGTVDFVSRSVGFALGKGGRLWRTRNRRPKLARAAVGRNGRRRSRSPSATRATGTWSRATSSSPRARTAPTTCCGPPTAEPAGDPSSSPNSRDVNGLLATASRHRPPARRQRSALRHQQRRRSRRVARACALQDQPGDTWPARCRSRSAAGCDRRRAASSVVVSKTTPTLAAARAEPTGTSSPCESAPTAASGRMESAQDVGLRGPVDGRRRAHERGIGCRGALRSERMSLV